MAPSRSIRPPAPPAVARARFTILLLVLTLLPACAPLGAGATGSQAAPGSRGAPGALASSSSGPSAASLGRLETELVELSRAARGVVGVGVIHLETGRELFLHGGEPFPMASTYKVPIAVELLRRVDRGEVRLDSMVVLEPTDISPGSGTLSRLFQHPGVALSVRNLMELMMLISDNSATDVVIRTAGGAGAVTARMRALGHAGIRVDRTTTGLIADYLGVPGLPPEARVQPDRFGELVSAVSDSARAAAASSFDADPQDTSTPEAMARLLAQVWRAEALSRESSELLLDIMSRSTTGESRILGLLPRGTRVSHKTGTIGRVTNDVGIIHLPRGAGNVVMVAFVKESAVDIPAREQVIAQLSRAVYDYFLFNPGGEW